MTQVFRPAALFAVVCAAMVAVAAFGGLQQPVSPSQQTAKPAIVRSTVNAIKPAPKPVPRRVTTRPDGNLTMVVREDLPIRQRPGAGPVIGTLESSSAYLRTPTRAWLLSLSEDGEFGQVVVPYSHPQRIGWVRVERKALSSTPIEVHAYLARHIVEVRRGDEVLMRIPVATGAPDSPSPVGRYFVVDRVDTGNPSGSFGHFAFGLSGIQPNTPKGWTGGNQMAIHGTNDPGSIGRSVSAGCLRASARDLDRLKPLLQLGTPVMIHP